MHSLMTPADLTAARESLRLSQRDLAGVLGIHPNILNRWENGKAKIPPYLHLAMIGVAFQTQDIKHIVAETIDKLAGHQT